MMKKIDTPPTAYASSSPGPASWIALAEPRNSPTPIVPPMAISWMWRLRRLRAREVSGFDMSGVPYGSILEWTEQRVAPALGQLVALHDDGGTGCSERAGSAVARSSAAHESLEPM